MPPKCTARVDAQVRVALGAVMAQRRSAGVAFDYVVALSPGTKANCWALAESAGHEGWGRMQGLLWSYRWEWTDLRARLPALAAAWIPDTEGDLIGPGVAIDETAQLKRGDETACMAPQHAGCTGQVENCLTTVFSVYVTAHGQAWADFDVYMPDRWASDLARRGAAGIPDSLEFATKPQLAMGQLGRLTAAGLPIRWVAFDEDIAENSAQIRAGAGARVLVWLGGGRRGQAVGRDGRVADVIAGEGVAGLRWVRGRGHADWPAVGHHDQIRSRVCRGDPAQRPVHPVVHLGDSFPAGRLPERIRPVSVEHIRLPGPTHSVRSRSARSRSAGFRGAGPHGASPRGHSWPRTLADTGSPIHPLSLVRDEGGVALEVAQGLLADGVVELDGEPQMGRDDLGGFGGPGQVAGHDQVRARRAAGEFPGGSGGLLPAGRGEAGRRRGLPLDPARDVPATLAVPDQPEGARGRRGRRPGLVPRRRAWGVGHQQCSPRHRNRRSRVLFLRLTAA